MSLTDVTKLTRTNVVIPEESEIETVEKSTDDDDPGDVDVTSTVDDRTATVNLRSTCKCSG